MKNRLLLVSALMLLSAEPAWAVRYGSQLVLEGQYEFDVMQKCGSPAWRNQRVAYRSVIVGDNGFEMNRPTLSFGSTLPVYIDEWFYNFGPGQLMQVLIFVNGRLVQTKDLSYGY